MYIIIRTIGGIHSSIQRHYYQVWTFFIFIYKCLDKQTDSPNWEFDMHNWKNDLFSAFQDSDDDDTSMSDEDDEENETQQDDAILGHS